MEGARLPEFAAEADVLSLADDCAVEPAPVKVPDLVEPPVDSEAPSEEI